MDIDNFSVMSADRRHIAFGLWHASGVWIRLSDWGRFLSERCAMKIRPDDCSVDIKGRVMIGSHKLPFSSELLDGHWCADVNLLANAAGFHANVDIASRSVVVGNRRLVPRDDNAVK